MSATLVDVIDLYPYLKHFIGYTRGSAQDLKDPVWSEWTHGDKGDGVEKITVTANLNGSADESLLLVAEARGEQASADDLLQEVVIDGNGIAILLDGNNQGTQTANCRLEKKSALLQSDVLLSEPRILVEGTDQALVGAVVATLSKGGL